MEDIVSRLRATDKHMVMDLRSIDVALNLEAADEIERLRDALKPFGDIGAWLFSRPEIPDSEVLAEFSLINGTVTLTRGHFKAASACLDGPDKGGEDAPKAD